MTRLWLLRFVFVLSIIMMMSNTALSDRGNVWIRNSLPNQKDLIVHCKSADQDMGYHRVHSRRSYNLLYKLRYEEYFYRLYENNGIWCHVWQGHDFMHHQVFDVRYGEQWEAREDGIYRQSALVYAWDATISKAYSLGSSCCFLLCLLKKVKGPMYDTAFAGVIYDEDLISSMTMCLVFTLETYGKARVLFNLGESKMVV
ncbi:unnamed protein product [Eruca vesicaria subsp. sativa]|uniref:S-protein homolog n=1 Tax=Eruca vesicaria subsp. sativa TaxID=29727 RepID=A0ABC8JPH6_ERUVS|nr:unnamed protein product [Eruca vesicaria subsp. sativa]